MHKIYSSLLIMLFCLASSSAYARDDVSEFSIQEAMSQEQAKEVLGSDVRFYFGSQSHGKILKTWGEVSTNKKTNAFLKSDQEACTWAFLSAMVALRDRTLREGGNAVIKIKSNYKSNTTSSTTTFRCGAGNILAGVALKGTVVKLP
jgi:uncharacterized protein YbjQ (UPF0145 family)